MDWKIKALVQNGIAVLPKAVGNKLYFRLQYSKGNLRPNSMYDTAKAFFFMDRVKESDKSVDDMTFFELGSGWALQIPLCLWLCGVNRVITVDLNRHFNPQMATEYISYWEENLDEFLEVAGIYGKSKTFQDRLSLLFSGKNDPEKLFKTAGIEYRAPYDARTTDFKSGSVDVYYSTNVLEHVPADDIIAKS